MRYTAYWWAPTFTLTLIVNGCSAFEPRVDFSPAVEVFENGTIDSRAKSSNRFLPTASLQKLNLDIYGASYHTDRKGVKSEQLDNERNPGLGLGYELRNNKKAVAFLLAGFYQDSGRNWTRHAGLGYQIKLGNRWRIGATLMAIKSQTYNNGRVFIAPVPLLSYDIGRVKLNVIYAPKIRQLNDYEVFGMYLSIPFRHIPFKRR